MGEGTLFFCGTSIDVHYPHNTFDVCMCSFFHYPIEVNWVSNHLFQNLFDWCWSLIYSNPSPYKWVSPEIALHVLPLPTETQRSNHSAFLHHPTSWLWWGECSWDPERRVPEEIRGSGCNLGASYVDMSSKFCFLCNCYPDVYIFTY